ncbi:alpha/beta hydrolase [Bradyrhizobium sp. 188]|uniref:alpha/beta fold hydrolase n=1 Tax=Bradyrhizobium sp. 188 TaxID=2782656 RepID=UPI001FF8D5E8|nr:alpha/beta hydrolase [Bradyrhizobium sp. 188]MCK1502141.1 alpha/beta hydrolase [Bradyrhizobium sp. 188]
MFIQLEDARIFFDVEGTGLSPQGPVMREKPVMLCLHGGPGLDHTSFRPELAPLAAQVQLIYLDQRGHGRSSRGDVSHWSLAQWAEDVRSFCDALGIEHPIVLGTSFGGYVAMAYAIRYPSHPAKLVLASTSARGTANAERRANMLHAFEKRGGPIAREALRRALDERDEAAYADFAAICGPLYNRRQPDPAAMLRILRNPDILPFFEGPGGEGATFDLVAELTAIRAPTLILAGEDDPITPPEEQERIASAMAPGLARLVRFSGCGHGVLRDDAEGMRAAIAKFVTSAEEVG